MIITLNRKKPYKAPSKELEELFKEFKKNDELVNCLFGVFYNEDGRRFYKSKVLKMINILLKMVRVIDEEYAGFQDGIIEVIKIPRVTKRTKTKAIKEIFKVRPGIPKQIVSRLVGCSVRQVERVIYGEV